VQRLGERLGNNRRFRIPYLWSMARLSAWEGQSEQAISHLHEAAGLAEGIGERGEALALSGGAADSPRAAAGPGRDVAGSARPRGANRAVRHLLLQADEPWEAS
jgi:hypothetical protein